MGQDIAPKATEWLDELKFTRLHVVVILIAFLTLFFDGYSTFMLGYIIPQMMKEWKLTPVAAGALASYTLAGLLLGSLLFGMLGDILGRKKALVIGLLTFSLFTSFSYWAPGFSVLVILRFFGGLGMGGAMPLANVIVSEYVPARARARSVTITLTGLSIGAVTACVSAMTVLPRFGWRSLFLFQFLALILVPFLIAYLPESIRFLSRKQRYDQAIRELRRLERAAGSTPHDWTAESFALPVEVKVGIKQLFTPKYATMTILLWCAFILNMFALFGTQTWLPALFVKEGYSVVRSVSYALLPQATIIFGSILLGYNMDRFGRKQGLIIAFVGAGIATYLFSVVRSNIGIYLVGALYGMTGGTCMNGLQVVNGEIYPTQFRSTGAGWAITVGRLGAIVGPLLGGALQMAGFTFNQFFIIFALPTFMAAVIVFFFRVNVRGEGVETVTGKLAGTISTAGE